MKTVHLELVSMRTYYERIRVNEALHHGEKMGIAILGKGDFLS